MPIYNQQQQSVILKGIAQNILQMNVPTFEQATKLFKEFDRVLVTKDNDDLLEYIYHHFNGAFDIESFKKGLSEKNQSSKPWKPIEDIEKTELKTKFAECIKCNAVQQSSNLICQYPTGKNTCCGGELKEKPGVWIDTVNYVKALEFNKTHLIIDPPSGWKYGFPKPISKDEYDSLGTGGLNAWLVTNGYPLKEIESYGEHFHVSITE